MRTIKSCLWLSLLKHLPAPSRADDSLGTSSLWLLKMSHLKLHCNKPLSWCLDLCGKKMNKYNWCAVCVPYLSDITCLLTYFWNLSRQCPSTYCGLANEWSENWNEDLLLDQGDQDFIFMNSDALQPSSKGWPCSTLKKKWFSVMNLDYKFTSLHCCFA